MTDEEYKAEAMTHANNVRKMMEEAGIITIPMPLFPGENPDELMAKSLERLAKIIEVLNNA